MRILHISDLHFGAHDDGLKSSLISFVNHFHPDVIVATGDLANQPKTRLLRDAKDYLTGLAAGCANASSPHPRVIAVPGNHDQRYFGTLQLNSNKFDSVFSGVARNYYYKEENIWIYGFDSCLKMRTGANGKISDADLQDFRDKYWQLRGEHGERFRAAFKIVALHHHPIPIKDDSTKSRWLSLTNAAAFLKELLDEEIDLVLHGHEHVKAWVSYGRHRSEEIEREIPIVAVSSALKKHHADGGNWVHLIEVANHGKSHRTFGFHTAQIDCYMAAGANQFELIPQQTFNVEPRKKAARRYFELQKDHAHYHYGDVSSIAKIDPDGDAHRIVECHDLTTDQEGTVRSAFHDVSLPHTSGYLDCFLAQPLPSNKQRLVLRMDAATANTPKQDREKAKFKVEFGTTLVPKHPFSYQYHWWAVNAFALNSREGELKYGTDKFTGFEYTHYPVDDPIKALTVIAQFPEHKDCPTEFHIRIAPLDNLEAEDGVLAGRLAEDRALRYYESIRSVALRISNPLVGYSYGIKWRVPRAPHPLQNAADLQIEEILHWLLANEGKHKTAFMKDFLYTVASTIWRKELGPFCRDLLDVGLAILDQKNRRMVMVADAFVGESARQFEWQDYSKLAFRYGEGIAGKVFKTNAPRLYIQKTESDQTGTQEPDFYLTVPGTRSHAGLFCMPIRNPWDPSHIYGVMCCGGFDRVSNIWESLKTDVTLKNSPLVQRHLDLLCYNLLKKKGF